MSFSDEQVEFLLRPINPLRVHTLRGNSYLKGWDVRAHLNRVFGFGNWSVQTTVEVLYAEQRPNSDGKDQWHVGAVAHAKLTILVGQDDLPDPYYEDVASDEAVHPNRGEATDNVTKSAASGALKRCAVNLGDQFGLSLYNDGSTAPSVQTVTPWARGPAAPVVDQKESDKEPETETEPESPAESGAFK